MIDHVRRIPAETLDHSAYHQDFAHHLSHLSGVVWKLERSQTFREVNDPSWRALMAGRWHHSLTLLEAERDLVRAQVRRNTDQRVTIRRIRIVEASLSPYLQWELNALRILAEEGFEVRALQAEHVAHLERAGQLPELVIIGDRVLYDVQYEADWTPCGARRIIDPSAIRSARSQIAHLFELGEPLLEFFDREVAPLPAPVPPSADSRPSWTLPRRSPPAADLAEDDFPSLTQMPAPPRDDLPPTTPAHRPRPLEPPPHPPRRR
ncbi:DUF6879 family protein [Actinomadura sp. NPDC048955]|uniref:DUF6879 family protein n=1 Tax=Actinomadura sp. NPDC048955 TaxID=3158228 RepID=UPI0034114489